MAGVYISYPFCAQKCTYCNFASGVFPASLEKDYVRAIGDEIRNCDWQWQPETLYLGGGSPGRMTPEAIRDLTRLIPGRPWAEATIEAAPGEITREKADLWATSGITRVSLGVQSFVRSELARTGRKHTAETVAADVAVLREAGVSRINIDLIAGLPGQTGESWAVSLEWIKRLDPGHVSVYMLEVDEDSRLGRELLGGGRRYGAGEVPGEEQIVNNYESALKTLAAAGINRYEISNFARPGEESLHNLKYWRLEPYVGFGADAHSFDGRLRLNNAETATEYVARWSRREPVRVAQEEARISEERFFVGLRLQEGIQPASEEWQRFREQIERLLSSGLLETDGRRLKLTAKGIMLSNEVFQEFITT